MKLLGPIFVDAVGPLMATTESSKKAGTNFLNKYLAVGIVWCDYGVGKVYRFLYSTAPIEVMRTYACANINSEIFHDNLITVHKNTHYFLHSRGTHYFSRNKWDNLQLIKVHNLQSNLNNKC